MDLLQLKYFQVVAQLEHMTRAAEKLYIAQPSLSQSIAKLEDELGVPLFDRQGRRIHLNQFGRVFLKRVEHIFLELEEGKREVADMAGLERGSIALAVASTQPLPELLSGFLARYPRVRFRLFQQHSLTTVVQQLERGEIDLCISSPPIEQPGITWVPLLTEEIFLLVPAEHRLAGRGSIRFGSELATLAARSTLCVFAHRRARLSADNWARLARGALSLRSGPLLPAVCDRIFLPVRSVTTPHG